jgi:hypothetical protein
MCRASARAGNVLSEARSSMTKSKTAGIAEARKHLELARHQWDDASTDWLPPADPAGCVTKCFYAFENAIVAAAEALAIPWKKTHPDKARIAVELAAQKRVTIDISDRLVELNTLRKDVSYGETGQDLAAVDLEDLLSELETFLGEVAAIVDSIEELTASVTSTDPDHES